MITDNNNIANEFNKYFTSIGNQLAKEIKSNTSYKAYLKIPNQNSFFLRPTSEDLSIVTGNHPDQLKIAKVIPLFKKM